MTLQEAAYARHSVRAYEDKPIPKDVKSALEEKIADINARSGLNFQLVADEPEAFDCFLAHYGKFGNVENQFALVGRARDNLQEKCGYYGEELVLFAQTLGLNTCWVALTYKKVSGAYKTEKGEKLALVVSVGYGKTQGTPHKSKGADTVCEAPENAPLWFTEGVKGALLAPTAVNQQKFKFILHEYNVVEAVPGVGFYAKVDLGIAKYHFELFAGKENFTWKE